MGCSEVADGGEVLQVWGVSANILNTGQPTRGIPSSLGVGRRANNPSPKKVMCYEIF